jgi:hypothetical protein
MLNNSPNGKLNPMINLMKKRTTKLPSLKLKKTVKPNQMMKRIMKLTTPMIKRMKTMK